MPSAIQKVRIGLSATATFATNHDCVAPAGRLPIACSLLSKLPLLMVAPQPRCKPMNDLAETTEHPLTVRQAEPPRVDVRVDLYAIRRDLQAIESEIALRPIRWEILKLAVGCLATVVVALLIRYARVRPVGPVAEWSANRRTGR
jgi:hypothetical protein